MAKDNPLVKAGMATAAFGVDAATGTPAGTATLVGFEMVSNFMIRISEDRADLAYETFVSEWALAAVKSPEEAREQVKKLLTEGDPEHDDKLYESFRHMAFSRGDASWPYIAKLTAEYIDNGQPTDAFFKRVGGLLERCEDQDIALLERLLPETWQCRSSVLEDLAEQPSSLKGIDWQVDRSLPDNPGTITIYAMLEDHPGKYTQDENRVTGGYELDDILVLLEESRLAVRSVGQRVSFPAGSDSLERLCHLFGCDGTRNGLLTS